MEKYFCEFCNKEHQKDDLDMDATREIDGLHLIFCWDCQEYGIQKYVSGIGKEE